MSTAKLAASICRAVVWNLSLAWEMKTPPSAAPLDYKCSELNETVDLDTFNSDTGLDLESNNLDFVPCLGKSFTNVAPVISPAGAHASEKSYQLAEIMGVSRTLPGTL